MQACSYWTLVTSLLTLCKLCNSKYLHSIILEDYSINRHYCWKDYFSPLIFYLGLTSKWYALPMVDISIFLFEGVCNITMNTQSLNLSGNTVCVLTNTLIICRVCSKHGIKFVVIKNTKYVHQHGLEKVNIPDKYLFVLFVTPAKGVLTYMYNDKDTFSSIFKHFRNQSKTKVLHGCCLLTASKLRAASYL